MASTRNRNTPGNYQAEQDTYRKRFEYFSYEHAKHYGVPSVSYFAGDGLIGMKAPHRNLSQNYCDIESQLLGIGSTNLVNPLAPVVPQMNDMKSLNMIDKIPMVMPKPLLQEKSHRYMFLN